MGSNLKKEHFPHHRVKRPLVQTTLCYLQQSKLRRFDAVGGDERGVVFEWQRQAIPA